LLIAPGFEMLTLTLSFEADKRQAARKRAGALARAVDEHERYRKGPKKGRQYKREKKIT
jgi:hypothetical protein